MKYIFARKQKIQSTDIINTYGLNSSILTRSDTQYYSAILGILTPVAPESKN